MAGTALLPLLLLLAGPELLPELDLSRLSVLMLHAVNPWGYRHRRRVSENNVDLNRNFAVGDELFDLVNQPYADIDDFLNPTQPVSLQSIEDALGEVVQRERTSEFYQEAPRGTLSTRQGQ